MCDLTARNHLNSAGVKMARAGIDGERWYRILTALGCDEQSRDAGIRGFASGIMQRRGRPVHYSHWGWMYG